jgi:hypothetical protein
MRRPLIAAAVLAVGLLALIPVGRWEARRHARSELAGIRTVLAVIGPIDDPSLDAYRQGVAASLDCLLYKRANNPFALEFCVDPRGRVVEAYDRRGSSPKIWSIREDPAKSTISIGRARVDKLIAFLKQPA